MIELRGQIERITFTNEENGYTVARVRLESGESATVVGILHDAAAGSFLEMRGEWTTHPKFGSQFKLEGYQSIAPSSTETIEKYLAAGAVKGIGPVTAKMIVDRFGAESLDIMDRNIGRLREIPGIGRKRLAGIKSSWEGQKEVREVMLFLQGNGVGPAYAARIYRRYGKGAIEAVKRNPYRLASDIDGIGFQTADRIAGTLGYPREGEQRAEAGLAYVLERCGDEGHLYLPARELLRRGAELLESEEGPLRRVLAGLERRGGVVVDRSLPAGGRGESGSPSGEIGDETGDEAPVYPPRFSLAAAGSGELPGEPAATGRDDEIGDDVPVYPPRLYEFERAVARRLRKLLSRTPPAADTRPGAAGPLFGEVEDARGTVRETRPSGRDTGGVEPLAAAPPPDGTVNLGADQLAAVQAAFENPVVVITGGPGTGKTTVVDALARGFSRSNLVVFLAAPTGRAAKRMSEATGREAKTIHRLLEVGAGSAFKRTAENPLECDVLIVDEISMVDVPLMAALLAALPERARLVLVGDADQLPSVGPGNLLGDIIDSGAVPVARLGEVYRQEEGSRIITGAYDIIHGTLPEFAAGEEGDFYFIEQDDPERVVGLVTTLVGERIPSRFGFESIDEIQVLTPMNRGAAGTINLNETLQQALNPSKLEVSRGERSFRVGDKVMQTRNNYDLDVFNGDIGRVRRADREASQLVVAFDGREVSYEAENIDELRLAYAVTVHKAQGSEFPAVVIALTTQAYLLLQRNLLYTAVTRGKRLVVIVGSRKALSLAIHNDRTQRRYTALATRLSLGY